MEVYMSMVRAAIAVQWTQCLVAYYTNSVHNTLWDGM